MCNHSCCHDSNVHGDVSNGVHVSIDGFVRIEIDAAY